MTLAVPTSDPALPGLATAMSPAAVRALLERHLPEARRGAQIEDVRVASVQYRPGSRCLILYGIKARPSPGRRRVSQWMAGEVLRADRRPGRVPETALEACRRPGPGWQAGCSHPIETPQVYVPEAHLLITALPWDPALPWLCDAFDPAQVKAGLNRMWAAQGVRVREIRIAVAGYTPRSRATLFYDLVTERRGTYEPARRRLVAKGQACEPAAKLFAGAWALWRAAGTRVHLAPPVGFLGELNLTVQERIDGVRLNDFAGRPGFVGLARKAARGIATVHGAALPVAATWRPHRAARDVAQGAEILAGVRPELASRARRLSARLAADIEDRALVRAPIHGDFHLANVLVDADDRVFLIDLDQLAIGDPLIDVARFLSALRISALRVHDDHRALGAAEAGFAETYLSVTGEDLRRLRLYESAFLLQSATTPFRLQWPGWENAAEALLEEAEHTHVTSARVATGPPDAPRQSRSPRRAIGWSGDARYLTALLHAPILERFGADLIDCRVRERASDDDHQRFRLRLKGWHGGKKWSCAAEGTTGTRRGQFERWTTLSEAAARVDAAPVLPRPVGYLGELRMMVCEAIGGRRIHQLVTVSGGDHLMRRVGAALGALHTLPIDLGETTDSDGVPEHLDDLLAAVQEPPALAGASLEPLIARCRSWVDTQARRAPVIKGRLLDVLIEHDGRVALRRAADVVMGDPLIAFGDFLASWMLAAPPFGSAARRRLLEACVGEYMSATGDARASADELVALGLVRRLVSRFDRRRANDAEGPMLAAALAETAARMRGLQGRPVTEGKGR